MIEKIIPYLSDFCADGSSKGPLLNQKVGIEMHKKLVGGGDLGYRLIGVGGFQRLPEQVEAPWTDLPVEERGPLIIVGVFINLYAINFLLLTLPHSPP